MNDKEYIGELENAVQKLQKELVSIKIKGEDMPEDFSNVEVKPFKDLPLKSKLELIGIKVVPTETGAPDPYGVEESLDLFDLATTIANKIVNKDSFLDFNLVGKGLAVYKGGEKIPNELTHLSERELTIIQDRVTAGLKFNNPDQVGLELLIERITFATLLLLYGITEYTHVNVD